MSAHGANSTSRAEKVNKDARRLRWADAGAALLLACYSVALYARLLLTNRVLASGDILLYFYPYRDYVAAALREGALPWWNPYSFLGAPLLANPQAAVFYPLHWPLLWLPVTEQIYWSAALHTWILALGGYVLVRGWGLDRWAALVAGLIVGGSGFYGGLIGHINQMNGAAWLPWALWVLATVDAAPTWRRMARATGGMGLLVLLMFLAGHTQTLYINLVGLGLFAVWPLAWLIWSRRARQHWRGTLPWVLRRLAVLGLGAALGLLAAAPQLLPTLQLSALGLRQGGLGYGEVSSFSLRPLHLLWTLLPTYGLVDLSVVFGTLGYTEFVAYVGFLGLFLALYGLWRARGPLWAAGALLAAGGFFLALGRWNPFYYLLYLVVPGFDLFRAPARWMMLYTLGMALLAAAGMARLLTSPPSWLQLSARGRAGLGALICALLALELIAAAASLPHTHTTAPQAVYEVRTAPAHLLTDPARASVDPAAAGRFLGMSTITYDPGDMADYGAILHDAPDAPLDDRAFEQFIIALKMQELLVPNLALLWRIPSLDGFDGGVLPLARYLDLLTLFVPREDLVADGRLREQVTSVPPARLLSLYNVQYVVTDKVRDLWFEDVYYDRQIGATLGPSTPAVSVTMPQPFPATHLHLIAALEATPDAMSVQSANQTVLTVTVGEGAPQPLTAGAQPGADLADAALDSPIAAASGATVAYRDQAAGRQEYRVILPLDASTTAALTAAPAPIHLVWAQGAPPVTIQAATLVDARTGMFTPLLPSDQGEFRLVHSGDVKIYENLDVLPRAYLVHATRVAADPAEALEMVRQGDFDPADVAVVEGGPALDGRAAGDDAAADDAAIIQHYAPERVVIHTRSHAPALLVLSDTHYPGWRATVDGADAPIYRTNVAVRGVAVPAGEHTVTFTYRSSAWPWAAWLGGAGLILLALLLWGGPARGGTVNRSVEHTAV